MTQHQEDDQERPRVVQREEPANRASRPTGPLPITEVEITWYSAFKIAIAMGVVAIVCGVCVAVVMAA